MKIKSKKKLFRIAISILFLSLLIFLVTYSAIKLKGELKIIFLSISVFISFATFIFLISMQIYFVRQRINVHSTFNDYVENNISQVGVGMIAYDDEGTIIWISKFIQEEFGNDLVGSNFEVISESFYKNFYGNSNTFRFNNSSNSSTYEAMINKKNKSIVIKDVTIEEIALNENKNERKVIAELEIDNFQQYQVVLPEEILFSLQAKVIELLDKMTSEYNLIYRQYLNGKYLVLTNQESIDKILKLNFSFLNKFRVTIKGVKLTVSIGIGVGQKKYSELMDVAKKALNEAQARGGDQIAIIADDNKTIYYGSQVEIPNTISRVKIKKIAQTFEKKLNSKTIKNLIVFGHKKADLDAVGASMLIANIAKEYNKQTKIQNDTFDLTTKEALADLSIDTKNIFVNSKKAKKMIEYKSTLIVIVDTAEEKRIELDKVFSLVEKENIFVFDHHRISEISKTLSKVNTYIDTSASSASEIIVELIMFLSKSIKLSKETLQMGLNGIYLDTDNFSKSVTYKTFEAAAWLKAKGANPTLSTNILKPSAKTSELITKILKNTEEVKSGCYLAQYDNPVPSDIISLAANKMLNIKGRKAAFVVAKLENENEYKMSARSINTNVQIIAEAVGGGGHFSTAAATSKEKLRTFVDNIKQAIIDSKINSNENK